MKDKLVLTPAEARAILGVSKATIYELIRQGKIPATRLGGRLFIGKRAFESLFDAAPSDSERVEGCGAKELPSD